MKAKGVIYCKGLVLTLMALCCFLSSFVSSCYAEADYRPANYKVSKDYVENYFTSLAAASCLGQYLENNSMEFNYLRIMGWQVRPQISRSGKLETHFTVAQRYFKDLDRKVFMVTFRGSATKMDWKINLKTHRVNYGGSNIYDMQATAKNKLNDKGPGVHGGFNTYTDNVLRNSVVSDNNEFMGAFALAKDDPKAHVILTGHSMGGAVATLLATRLVDLGFPEDRLHVVTFGAPAIGNLAYNQQHANKLHIVRITNTNDPIPGSLQTFFNGYVQCGKNIKYHLSPTIGNIQHDMAMYFDHSIIDLYKTEDEEIAAGRMQPIAKSRIIKGYPVVALWAETSEGLKKMPLMPNLKRMLLDQYTRFIPSYIILNDNMNWDKEEHRRFDLIEASAKAGADYVIICSIDGRRDINSQYDWFIEQDQALFKKDGSMLTMTSFAKKVTPAVGNVQAAGENCLIAFGDLQKHLPFIGNLVEAKVQ